MLRKWVLVASLVGVTVLGGAGFTLALFTDSVQSGGQDFVAGTLALEGNRVDETLEGPIFYISNTDDGAAGDLPGARETGLWAPGDSHMREWQIENIGTLAARLTTIKVTEDAARTVKGPNGEDLADVLQVTVRDVHGNVLASGTLASFFDGRSLTPAVVLEPTDNLDLYITVELPLNTGNDYQGLKTVVTFTAVAEQVRNNP
ncbi:putative ribosomally synthesized peptide with SipW-like signal peptide [Symbiobacterium terraclitae]|uniref:Ribosomally synthesized peptide with SipW-like signal peptide n=1 Tax=Symbiobacterium terraclitae TaxID=557451 RepID=A0ABS4JNS8_9FIRM|nr:hypothetical protein [Symbiobacterium terraclitae]MBP2017182.1 putative ribosomally synthesized peptide with SipW-like signal peptide [Symbiobacterium terraclitae]